MFFKRTRPETTVEVTPKPQPFKGVVKRRHMIGESPMVNLVVELRDGEKVAHIEVRGSALTYPFLAGTEVGDEVEGSHIDQRYGLGSLYPQISQELRSFKNLTLNP